MPIERAKWITVSAWVLIVVCALCACGALLLAALLQFWMLNDEDMHGFILLMLEGAFHYNAPPYVLFLFNQSGVIFAAIGLSFVLHLLASIGLLQRKNWARWATVGFLVVSVVFALAGGFGLHVAMESVMQFALAQEGVPHEDLLLMQKGLQQSWMMSIPMTFVMVAPLVALIWNLLLPATRREFTPSPS
jgi:hypothetical protein